MNLEETLAEAITKAVNAAENGADFLASELPDYIQQLLMWHAISSGLLCALGIVLFFVLIEAQRRAWAWATRQDQEKPYGDARFGVQLMTAAYVLPVGIVYFNMAWLQILIAPKVFLVEYAARLVS